MKITKCKSQKSADDERGLAWKMLLFAFVLHLAFFNLHSAFCNYI